MDDGERRPNRRCPSIDEPADVRAAAAQAAGNTAGQLALERALELESMMGGGGASGMGGAARAAPAATLAGAVAVYEHGTDVEGGDGAAAGGVAGSGARGGPIAGTGGGCSGFFEFCPPHVR
jgi:hypothetical protein